MNTVTLVLLGIVLYTAFSIFLKSRGFLPNGVSVSGPITTIQTERGKTVLDALASPRRFWRVLTNLGLVATVGGMLLMLVTMPILAYIAVMATDPADVAQPQNVLVIPGVNEFLPLSVAPEIIAGLVIALVIHEYGHGILCRVSDIGVESMGVILFALVPMGAFVEPNEAEISTAKLGDRVRMFAAGITNNFVFSIVAIGLLFALVGGAFTVTPGAPIGSVDSGSPAEAAGIESGDRIVEINDAVIDDGDEFETRLDEIEDRTVTVTLASGEEMTVERSAYITHAPDDVMEQLGMVDSLGAGDDPPGITSVDGEPVNTEREFRAAIGDEPVTVETTEGTFELVPGAFVADGGQVAANSELSDDEPFLITRIDGESIADAEELREVVGDLSAGEQVTLDVYADGESRTVEATVGEDGLLGVGTLPGVGGVAVSDFGAGVYPAQTFLDAMAGNAGGEGVLGLLAGVVLLIMLPLAGVTEEIQYNFAGFTGYNTEFYTVAVLPDTGAFLLVNLLYWSAWINLNLGLFNCIPAFPLDGGRIFQSGLHGIADRLPIGDQRHLVRAVVISTGILMVTSFLLLLFGQQIARFVSGG